MKILVTGSAGRLGEALMRVLQSAEHQAFGLDIKPSPYTNHLGSITDRDFVAACAKNMDIIVHTATLHKPHVGTHTTSVFGDARRPEPGAGAVWVTEDLQPGPKNIYGVSKFAGEGLCQIFHRNTAYRV